jgi:hypothetical protein
MPVISYAFFIGTIEAARSRESPDAVIMQLREVVRNFRRSAKGSGRAWCIDMSTEERLNKIERDVEVLRQEVRDLLGRFLKYVQDVEEDPVKD